MLALIYLGLAIALGDVLCRRFYRFVSVAHRWAAAVLVGVLLSTWFTYLAGLAFSHLAEPLLSADLLFFLVAASAIFWLSKKAPKVETITPLAPGSSRWDWITLGALFAVVCFLLSETLYINKQGRLLLSETQTSDFASQLAIAQNFALTQNFPIEFAHYGSQRGHYQFPLYFQAGNLEFLGLNLAWSVNVLSALGLTSLLALVMALGESLFNSRVVGRLGAALFLFHGSLRHSTTFLPFGYLHRAETWGFWSQIALVNQRQLSFAAGIFLLVLIFLVDWYRRRRSAKSFLFSGLLAAAMPLWNAFVFVTAAVALFCLLVAYGLWWLSRLKAPLMLGRILAWALTACILAAGLINLLAVYRSPRKEINYETDSLVKGLVFRRSVIYKIPGLFPTGLVREDSSKPPVTAFEGGHGSGKGQFNNPRGIAIDAAGNIFVADTDNGRIEKFSQNGTFVTSIGPFEAPNGIAIDRAGNIYIAEIDSKHRVQKLGPDGSFIDRWAPGFYGPRRIAIGPEGSIYVVDSGRSRIVKLGPDGQVRASWGSEGSSDGQFRGVSSVAVDATTNKVYVADPMNSRIQVFDSNGKLIAKWSIAEWTQPLGFEDLAVDPDRGRLYASSARMSVILVFDLQGNKLETLMPKPPDKLEGPSALALAKDKLFVLNSASSRVSVIVLRNM
jgi:DNA-binding beta-propeller fold protein YncE